ncbi:MAG: SDR family NAD(P)-dependent oxidoreductase [Myxococcales bacterium]|nr:SDR family NAD(P)-dependent oxidoreductase [Myxococcales bacterium]
MSGRRRRRFEGQGVWITGGGSGLGRALALELAREGAALAVSGRRRERLDEVVEAIAGEGAAGFAVPCDVTDDEGLRAAAEEAAGALGGMHVAIANAGFAVSGRVAKLTADQWRRQLDVNVVGAALTARYALPYLRQTSGRLVLIGSVASMITTSGSGAYCASKAAVRAIGQALSLELHGSGVTCTTIHPGFVESEIAQVDNQGVFDASREDHRPQKLMWPADRAASAMVDAIAARRREYVFTGHGKVGAFIGRHAPGFVHFAQTRRG